MTTGGVQRTEYSTESKFTTVRVPNNSPSNRSVASQKDLRNPRSQKEPHVQRVPRMGLGSGFWGSGLSWLVVGCEPSVRCMLLHSVCCTLRMVFLCSFMRTGSCITAVYRSKRPSHNELRELACKLFFHTSPQVAARRTHREHVALLHGTGFRA